MTKEQALKREEFKKVLEDACKFLCTDVDRVIVVWDEEDIVYCESHECVLIDYKDGYRKCVNTNINSFRSTFSDVVTRV